MEPLGETGSAALLVAGPDGEAHAHTLRRAAAMLGDALGGQPPETGQPAGGRWLWQAFARLAEAREHGAVLSVVARAIGSALGLACVQVGEIVEGELVLAQTWLRDERAREHALDGPALVALAEAGGYERRVDLEDCRLGLPLRTSTGTHGYLAGYGGQGDAAARGRRRLGAPRRARRGGAREPARVRAQGVRGRHGRAHRPRQPPQLPRDDARPRGGAPGGLRARARRHRRLQGAQRHARPRRGRRRPARGRRAAAPRHAPGRQRLPHRRRGVRAAAAGDDEGQRAHRLPPPAAQPRRHRPRRLAADALVRRRELARRRQRSARPAAGGRRGALRGQAPRQGPHHVRRRAADRAPLADDVGAHAALVRADAPPADALAHALGGAAAGRRRARAAARAARDAAARPRGRLGAARARSWGRRRSPPRARASAARWPSCGRRRSR